MPATQVHGHQCALARVQGRDREGDHERHDPDGKAPQDRPGWCATAAAAGSVDGRPHRPGRARDSLTPSAYLRAGVPLGRPAQALVYCPCRRPRSSHARGPSPTGGSRLASSRSPSAAPPSAARSAAGWSTFFTMAYIVVLNPLIIGTQARTAPASSSGRRRAEPATLVAAADRPRRRRHDHAHGRRRQLPARARHGPRASTPSSRSAIAKLPEMTWADAMGLVVLEGIIILVLVLTGFRQAVFRAIPAQLKTAISRRHRPVHHHHRPGRRRLRPRSRRAGRSRSSSASAASSTAGRCWSSSSACSRSSS